MAVMRVTGRAGNGGVVHRGRLLLLLLSLLILLLVLLFVGDFGLVWDGFEENKDSLGELFVDILSLSSSLK